MIRIVSALLLAVVLMPRQAAAEQFDGSTPLLCAVRSILECGEIEGCERVMPASINAPAFFRFDFEANTIEGTRSDQTRRISKIKRTEQLDGKLILQGAEDGIEGERDGLAWSVAIAEDTGHMVVSASGDDVAFVVFGACTHP